MLNSVFSFLRTKVVQNEEAGGGASSSGPMDMNIMKQPPKPSCLQYDAYASEWQQISAQDNFDGFRVEAGK